MALCEKELEDLIVGGGYFEHDGTFIHIIDRQVNIGEYWIDLLGADFDNNILYVIELKKEEVNGKALAQLLNYIHYMRKVTHKIEIKGLLIGKYLSPYMQLALNELEDIYFMKYELDINLNEDSWHIKQSYLEDEKFILQKQTIKDKIKNHYNNYIKEESGADIEPSKVDQDNNEHI